MKTRERPYTIKELIPIFQKGSLTISRWCKDGKIKGAFQDPGGSWLVPVSSPSLQFLLPPEENPVPEPHNPLASMTPGQIAQSAKNGTPDRLAGAGCAGKVIEEMA